MARNLKISINEYYHIYNRGVEKRDIFLDDGDRNRFVILLYLLNCSYKKPVELRTYRGLSFAEYFIIKREGERLLDIGAYCLMDNHFHLLVKERIEGGISLFMHRLATAYTMYFNKKYNRTGSLFQGVFKVQHADSDDYLKYLYSYIHLNPLKKIDTNWKEKASKLDVLMVKDYLSGYDYSSFIDYVNGDRVEKNILNMESFPRSFESREDFVKNIFDWLDYGSI